VAMYDIVRIRRVLIGRSELKNGQRVKRKFKITPADKKIKPFIIRSTEKISKEEALILASVKMHNTNEYMKSYVISDLLKRIDQAAAGRPEYIDYRAARWMDANNMSFLGDQRANLAFLKVTMQGADLRSNVVEQLQRQRDSIRTHNAPSALSRDAADWLRSHGFEPNVDPAENLALLHARTMNATPMYQPPPYSPRGYVAPPLTYPQHQQFYGSLPRSEQQQQPPIDRYYAPPRLYQPGTVSQPPYAMTYGMHHAGTSAANVNPYLQNHGPQQTIGGSHARPMPYQPGMVGQPPHALTHETYHAGPSAANVNPYLQDHAQQEPIGGSYLPPVPHQLGMVEQQPPAQLAHETQNAGFSPDDFDPHLQNARGWIPSTTLDERSRVTGRSR
jgi:hypothetical protein